MAKYIIVIFFFLLAIIFAFMDKNTQMLAFIATGFLFTFVLFAKEIGSYFSSIKIAGLDVQLRELENSISETKILAKIFATSIFEIIPRNVYISKYLDNTRVNYYDKISTILIDLKLKKEEIEEVQSVWHNAVHRYYTGIIFSKIRDTVNTKNKVDPELRLLLNSLPPQDILTTDYLKKYASDNNVLDVDIIKLIEEYEYYLKNKILDQSSECLL